MRQICLFGRENGGRLALRESSKIKHDSLISDEPTIWESRANRSRRKFTRNGSLNCNNNTDFRPENKRLIVLKVVDIVNGSPAARQAFTQRFRRGSNRKYSGASCYYVDHKIRLANNYAV